MMKRLTLIPVLVIGLLISPLVSLHAAPRQPNDAARIARLAALGKLWGAVKFFHPYLAYKDIDWDAALVQALPKVSAANTTEDYKAAVESLLLPLNDPGTSVFIRRPNALGGQGGPPRQPQPSETPQPYIKWGDDQVAVIVATDYVQFAGNQDKAPEFRKVFTEAQKAKSIIFDIRRRDGFQGSDWATNRLSAQFSQWMPLLLSENVTLSSIRHRMHSGFATQAGFSSGGYFSAFVTNDGGSLPARGPKEGRKQMVFLTSSGGTELHPLLGGLQAAGLATVIQEGDVLRQGGEYRSIELVEGVTVMLRTGEVVNPDGSVDFQPDQVVARSADLVSPSNPTMAAALKAARDTAAARPARKSAPAVASGKPDNPYRDMTYPSKEYRLLSLFRFWNIINYFFPYKHLLDKPWDNVLTDFIPRMEAAKDELEYALTVAEMVARIQDTHGANSSPVLSKYMGTHVPQMQVKYIEGQTVITRIYDESLKQSAGVNVGDVVLAVDGEEISKRRERLGRYFAISTPQSLWYRVNRVVLAGAENTKAALRLRGANGKEFEAVLDRSKRPGELPFPRTGPIYTVLPSGFGYIDLARLEARDVDAAFEAVKSTPGLIFDMRGYPKGVFYLIGPRLASKSATAALFSRPELHSPDPTDNTVRRMSQTFEPAPQGRYTGKVVTLINEDAISQSEHTCLFIEAATDVTFIGTPTLGANGDVTTMLLPGGFSASFTGHDVRHGDGRQLQRVGIQPHIKVEPTVKGVRAGKDEVLDKAVEFLKNGGRK